MNRHKDRGRSGRSKCDSTNERDRGKPSRELNTSNLGATSNDKGRSEFEGEDSESEVRVEIDLDDEEID